MSTDSQGRPLSDDGQWAWNGTEWVPAAGGPAEPEASAAAPVEDVNATMIAPSPFAGGIPGAAPQGGAPGYGSAPPAFGQAQGQAPAYGQAQSPGYGQAPGYPASAPGAPAGYGVPPQTKSRRPLILAIAGVLIIVAVVVVLIVALGGSSKKTVKGAFSCSAPGTAGTGVITFNSGGKYTLNNGGTGGSFTSKGSTVSFQGGDLNKITGAVSNGAKTVKLPYRGAQLTCKQ
jgi:hypothetical protein